MKQRRMILSRKTVVVVIEASGLPEQCCSGFETVHIIKLVTLVTLVSHDLFSIIL